MSSELYTLEDSLNLHERVEIIYVVDGYEASLIREDETKLNTAWGRTISNAIQNLNDAIREGKRNDA